MLEELFDKAVKKYFEVLAVKYHLEESAAESKNIFTFENENIILEVSFDSRRSFEMNAWIYNKKPSSKHVWDSCFNLYSIMELRAPEGYNYAIQTSNPEFVDEAVKTLARDVELYASDLLKGSQKGFQEVGEFQKNQTYEYNLKRDLSCIRDRLQKAWTDRNYGEIVKTLAPFKDHLMPSERKKLEYAQKALLK